MFAENLRRLREFKKMDKKELAKVLDISPQAVGQFELGKREPSLDTLKKISVYFGISLDALISDEDNTNTVKIKNLIKKLNYTIKEFAQDVGESTTEIEQIVLFNAKPSAHVIESICEKYNIPLSQFDNSETETIKAFCNAEQNREFVRLAIFLKENGFNPQAVKNTLLNITQLIKD